MLKECSHHAVSAGILFDTYLFDSIDQVRVCPAIFQAAVDPHPEAALSRSVVNCGKQALRSVGKSHEREHDWNFHQNAHNSCQRRAAI